MGYIESLLAEDERIVFSTRQHWLVLLPTILIDAGLAVVVVAFSTVGFLVSPPLPLLALLLLLVPLGHFLSRLNVWSNERYIVTDRRVMEVRGVVKKYVSDSSLTKINDVVMEQGALGRLLDYGDVRIITGADIGVDAFRRIAHPIAFKSAMLDQRSCMAGFPVTTSGEVDAKDIPNLLARLDDLRRRNVISESEFEREKQELLERL